MINEIKHLWAAHGFTIIGGVIAGVGLAMIIHDIVGQAVCRHVGWHQRPKRGRQGGPCPRCGKHVTQDSQGNWI